MGNQSELSQSQKSVKRTKAKSIYDQLRMIKEVDWTEDELKAQSLRLRQIMNLKAKGFFVENAFRECSDEEGDQTQAQTYSTSKIKSVKNVAKIRT